MTENTKIKHRGADKKWSARWPPKSAAYYPPEPYKGKGVRYAGEQIRRKEGKTVQ